MKHRITSKSVDSFNSYYNRRLLCLAGHVARMLIDRMPRKHLTGWVGHARPVGCPQMTCGRTLNKVLKNYDLPTKFGQWSTEAHLPQTEVLGSSGSAFGPPARVQQRL